MKIPEDLSETFVGLTVFVLGFTAWVSFCWNGFFSPIFQAPALSLEEALALAAFVLGVGGLVWAFKESKTTK